MSIDSIASAHLLSLIQGLLEALLHTRRLQQATASPLIQLSYLRVINNSTQLLK